MPKFTIIAGAIGCGKSTWIRNNRKSLPRALTNTDIIAQGIGDHNHKPFFRRAQDFVDELIEEFIKKGGHFGIETTYSGKRKAELVKRLHKAGWHVHAVYLTTSYSSINAGRVRIRVASGGHSASGKTIREVWRRTRENIRRTWKYFDTVEVFDVDGMHKAVPLATKNGDAFAVHVNLEDLSAAHAATIRMGIRHQESVDARKKAAGNKPTDTSRPS